LSLPQNNSIKVALLGNPNAGKSSLFNSLTGLNQKTGNYSGVTVDRFEGSTDFLLEGNLFTLNVIDLPGIYSLYPRSQDEVIACRTLLRKEENIEVVVLVIDSTSLKRNLLLATQVLDLRFRTVVALNMIDEAEKQEIRIDIAGLEKTLGVEVVTLDSRRQRGFEELKSAITRARASETFFYDVNAADGPSADYRSYIIHNISTESASAKFETADKIYRYNVINYLLARYVKTPAKLAQKERSTKIDNVVTHRVLGYVVLLFILFLVFQFIFYISETPMNWIERAFLAVGVWLENSLPDGWATDLLVKGLIPGVSGVVMFVPQIAFLFLFIGLLEDSGYMARASFIMDRVMRPFGLNGRSVIPLVSGTACAVPSIMATRSISNVKERLITIFILPLVSCSARLPVYTLLIAILYPSGKVLGLFDVKGIALLLLYLLGFAASLITAFFLKRIVKTRDASWFIMELPVYRRPQLRNIFIMMYNKVKVFVLEAGKVILIISVVLWFLSTHGNDRPAAPRNTAISGGLQRTVHTESISNDNLENSYIGKLGHLVEPVIAPLGFDWKIGIAIIASFAAREVFVGTMSTIYQSTEDGDPLEGIKSKLLKEKDGSGKPKYTAAVCWSLLLFYAFALQCMSTIAVVKRETKSWSWVLLQLLFMSALAYVSAFLAYRLLS
jgi:ferrous iron transport protein B